MVKEIVREIPVIEVFEEFFHARKKIIALLIFFFNLFAFGIIGYIITEKISPFQAFDYTVDTLIFKELELSDAGKTIHTLLLLFGIIVLWFTVWTSLDIFLEGHFHKYFSEVRLMDKIKKLKQHYILCGGGRVGVHVAMELNKKKIPFIIIEKDIHLIPNLKKKKFLVLHGDSLEEEILLEAGVEKAKALISVLSETEKNILVILTAKEINPNLKIYARAHGEHLVKKLKRAGADYVFLPEVICAEDIMKKVDKEELSK
ncbi:NAD-binding protein [Candidatus Woesearchaeota archaeon]|nr:NAD-binding protein [Candidatus Woesearchaeota archaeon]